MNVYRTTLCLTLFALPLPLWACSQMQPTAAFVVINDADRNGALDLDEWRNAQTGGNLETDFALRDEEEFYRLDYNRNNRLEAREIGFRAVRYIEAPCARFEAVRQKHLNRSSNLVHTRY